MNFLSQWITTEDFVLLKPINVFHKEHGTPPKETSSFTNYHVHFRKKFTLNTTENVSINISADDYYKLYVNGKFVCKGPAAAYPQNYKYNRFNISPFLKVGENIIAVHVYYQGLINRVWVSGDNRCGLIADIFQDDKFLFGTDESWRYSIAKEFNGDIIGYDTAFLENIDFRLEEKGWREIDYNDEHYHSSAYISGDGYTFCDTPAQAVDVYDMLPEKIINLGDGSYFIDFGQEIVGSFYMHAKGTCGDKVRVLYGEETTDENPRLARSDMRCNCNYDETCILSGELDKFEFFDCKAFRYVNIFSPEGVVDASTFSAVVSHHSFKEVCKIKTDIPHLENIWNLCRNTLKYGSQESISDCPSREKGLYLNDFVISGLSHFYLTGDKQYFRKALFDFADTAIVCPGLMAIANCAFMQEIADYSLLYPLCVINYYNATKDKETIEKLYPTVCGILDYFRKFEREDGLLENVHEKWNIVDWPENLRDNYDAFMPRDTFGIDCHNVLNAHYIGAKKIKNRICEILGYDEKENTVFAEKAFFNAFYNAETGLFCDSEKKTHSAIHSNVFPLFYDIADEAMYERLKSFIMKKGFSCGVSHSYFVCKVLAKLGAYEEELALIVNDSEHSWINMLREGATTCFEAWGKEQKWNTSLCHPWATSPIILICEDLAGKFGIELEKI